MFSMLPINREFEESFSLVRNVSIVKKGFEYKLNNNDCTITPYPTVEVKHT